MKPPIIHGTVTPELRPAPIEPSWILEGDPVARNAVLSRSRDGTASTLIWECTPGRFQWFYNEDETIHILEGSVVLDDGVSGARRLGAGDVVFFPAGAHVFWHVETKVRKLAFFRCDLPASLGFVARVMRKVRSRTRGIRNGRPSASSSLVLQQAG